MFSIQKYYLYKRPSNKIYYIGWRDSDNHRVWRSTGKSLKAEAVAFLKQFKTPTSESETLQKEFHTLDELLETYKSIREIRKTTIDSYSYAIKVFQDTIGKKSVETYTLKDIEDFKLKGKEKKLTPSTINIVFRSIRALFNFAVQREFLKQSPCKLSCVVKGGKIPLVYLSSEQIKILMEKIDVELFKNITEFALYTGCRLGEIVNLKWSNIDLEKRQILIGNDADFQTKTGKERLLPMHDRVYELLKRIKSDSKYVFGKPNGYRYEKEYISARFKFYCREAKIPESIHFHNLRHSFASHLVSSGTDIFMVSKLLGHSSVSTTEQFYASVIPSKLAGAIQNLKIG